MNKEGVVREERLFSGSQPWVHIRITKGACCKDTLFYPTPDMLNQNCLG